MIKNENIKEKAIEYLGGKICSNPYCKRAWYPLASYDFHHIKGQKEDNISTMIASGTNWCNIKKELDFCILLCAGCHRMIHYFKIKIYKDNNKIRFVGLDEMV